MKLETTRLMLRAIEPGDKEEVFKYRSDRQSNQYQGWIPESIEDVAHFIKNTSQKIDKAQSWFQFVIVKRGPERIIGDLGIHFFDPQNKQVEIGCTLDKNEQDKGYATEAVNAVINYLFRELDKHRITTSIDPENINAIRLVERLGFRKEAHYIESLWINGKWADDLLYAMTQKDWDKIHAENPK